MPIQHAIWNVSEAPEPLVSAQLASEQLLEQIIVCQPTNPTSPNDSPALTRTTSPRFWKRRGRWDGHGSWTTGGMQM